MNMLASLKAILFPAASQKIAGQTDAAPAEGAPDFTALMTAAHAPVDAVAIDAAPAEAAAMPVAALAPDMADAAPDMAADGVEAPAVQTEALPERTAPDRTVALALASRPAAIARPVEARPATPAAQAAVDAPVQPAPVEGEVVAAPVQPEPSIAPAPVDDGTAPVVADAKSAMKPAHPVQPEALAMSAAGEAVVAPVEASDDAEIEIETDADDARAADAPAQAADPLTMVADVAPIAVAPVAPVAPAPIPPAPVVAADAPVSADAPAAPVVAPTAVAATILPETPDAAPAAVAIATPAEEPAPARTERTAKPVKAEAVSLLQLVRDHMKARPAAATSETRAVAPDAPAAGDAIAAPAASAQPTLAPTAAPQSVAAQPILAPTPSADLSASLGAQVVDMGVSGQWIDGLARDIAGLSANGAQGRFQINADQLGPVQVDIRHGSDGATVSLTVATEAAEIALRQDSDRLKQDASLSAVRISEVKVERAPHVADASRADSTGNQTQSQSQSQGQNGGWQGAGQNLGQSSAQSHMQGRGQSRENTAFGHKGSSEAVVLNHEQAGDMSGDLPRARYA
ncbi:flagellar hook-length control protein FliK [Sphingobium rhizovicinum]|uniref:Flagellar hook-length control protein FliK n=1 Tax=Sphingobium rhizovicinum TaxID=432308 RepID=A0ABV7NJR8_9SPHN